MYVKLHKSDITEHYSCVLSCIDMGICVDSPLSFSEHINNIVVRANQRASLLLRCFLSKDSSFPTKYRLCSSLCLSIVYLSDQPVLLVILINWNALFVICRQSKVNEKIYSALESLQNVCLIYRA